MRTLVLALAALLGCDRGAPAPRERAAAPAPTAANDNRPAPLLWVIPGKAGASYLLGTMHLGIDAERDVPAVVNDLLAESRVFVMETDMSGVEPADVRAAARLPAGERLDAMLSADQWRRLRALLPDTPESLLRSMRPWYAVVAVAQTMLPRTEPMDTVLLRRARDQGRDQAFLETWRYQFEVIEQVLGVPDLVDVLDDYDDTKQELIDMAAGYRAGDADAIATILFDPVKYAKNPRTIDVLLTRRNEEWIPKLAAHIDAGRAFIAVGVGHLVGERGVIALLRARGYRVERFTLPQPRTRARPTARASGAR